MKSFTHILLLCALTLMSALTASAAGPKPLFPDETLTYKVMFKWGLVNKQAGTVDITLRSSGDRYNAILTARTDPWADRFYKVRDTLTSEMHRPSLAPLLYHKISHEGNEDKHDVVRFTRTVKATTIGNCTRKVVKDKKLIRDEQLQLEAMGTTVDMLSSFYFMRTLDFPAMKKGQVITINIFSGKRKELLTIKYLGIDKVKYDNRTYDAYHVSFIFTSDGKKRTSDDMDAWITTDKSRIPVKLEGKLPVGRVRCFYTGK